MHTKKLIKIGIAVVLLVALGIFAIILLQRPPQDSNVPRPNPREFFPFGRGENTPPSSTEEPPEETIPETPGAESLLRISQMSFFPVSGATPVLFARKIITEDEERQELIPAVRYVSKITGAVYQRIIADNQEQKMTETPVPQTYEALVSKSREVIYRYLADDAESIISYGALLPEYREGGDSALGITGSFLPEDITTITLSPDHSQIFYITESATGVTGTIASANGEKKTVIWTSPFSEWIAEWESPESITLTTKASFGIAGHAYSLNPKTRSFTKIIGDIQGLTTKASRDGKKLLIGEAGRSGMTLSILDMTTKERTMLPLVTLPEKCTWSRTGTIVYCAIPETIQSVSLPDAWYKGLVSFNDSLWGFSLTENKNELIADLTKETGQFFDAVNLMLDEDEQSLFFVNKKNALLWRADLTI